MCSNISSSHSRSRSSIFLSVSLLTIYVSCNIPKVIVREKYKRERKIFYEGKIFYSRNIFCRGVFFVFCFFSAEDSEHSDPTVARAMSLCRVSGSALRHDPNDVNRVLLSGREFLFS